MKKCARCCVYKPQSDFNKSSKNTDGLHSYCRQCSKKHYAENKSRHVANVKARKSLEITRIKEYIVGILNSGCIDCGVRDIRVLEFDHVTGQKVGGVGLMVRRGYSLEKVVEEIEKCEVRCRNCHIVKT